MRYTESLPEYAQHEAILPCYDIEKAKAEFNALTDEDKVKLVEGIAIATSDKQAVRYFRQAADDASESVKAIEVSFSQIRVAIIELGVDTGARLHKLDDFAASFRDIVRDSCSIALLTAMYARAFEDVVIKFCADTNLSVQQRIEKIDGFMKDNETINTSATLVQNRLREFEDNYTIFIGSLSALAQSLTDSTGHKSEELHREIENLDKALSETRHAIVRIKTELASAMGMRAIFATLLESAAPVITSVGSTISGVNVPSLIGLDIAKRALSAEKRQKAKELRSLNDHNEAAGAKVDTIDLIAYLQAFHTNVAVLIQVWLNVSSQAREILAWLQDGALNADIPQYMRSSLEQGVKLYKRMADYLEHYANGVMVQQLLSRS